MSVQYIRGIDDKITRSRYDIGSARSEDNKILHPRSAKTQSAVIFGTNQYGDNLIGQGDWVHFLVNGDGITQVVTGRYAGAALKTINEQPVELGDAVEIPASVATPLGMGAGRYKVVDVGDVSATVIIDNPIQYTLAHSREIGGAVYYRPIAGGGIEGLGVVPLALDGVVTQQRPTIPLTNIESFIDGNINTAGNGANSSWQSATFNVKVGTVPGSPPLPAPQSGDLSVQVIAAEMTVECNRQHYDAWTQSASFEAYLRSGKDGGASISVEKSQTYRKDTLQKHPLGAWVTSAEGRVTFYWVPLNPVTFASFRIYDASGSRAIFNDFKVIAAGVNSQIKLSNGTIPAIGSILNVTPEAAKTFIPAIKPGAYPVIKNDGVGPWVLGAPLNLIAPIGAALQWGLYIGDQDYPDTHTGAIALEIGSPYELRVNAPDLIGQVEYRITPANGVETVLASSDVRGNFPATYRPSVADMGGTATLTVTAVGWTKTYDLVYQYSQKGAIGLQPNAGFKTANTFSIRFTPDALRVFHSLTITTTAPGFTPVEVTGAARAFDLLIPAVGNYNLLATIAYADTVRPSETFSVPFIALP